VGAGLADVDVRGGGLMATIQVQVHLKSGVVLTTDKSEDIDKEQAEKFKEMLSDLASSSGSWEISLDIKGAWTLIPGSSIDFLQVITTEDES
jgi:hypothetical protein